jgi:hypothetical protein
LEAIAWLVSVGIELVSVWIKLVSDGVVVWEMPEVVRIDITRQKESITKENVDGFPKNSTPVVIRKSALELVLYTT